MDELAHFMKEKIDGTSFTILSGDFNILRYEIPPHYIKTMFGENPALVNHISLIEEEYAHLLEVLSNNGAFKVVNCWDRDNPDAKCVTIGESVEVVDSASGAKSRKPLETTMTSKVDQCADNCLDYIFQISPSTKLAHATPHFKISNSKVEKLLV